MAMSAPPPLLLADGSRADTLWTLDPTRAHLNHGSFGAVPRAAQDAQAQLRREMESAPVGWFVGIPARVRTARRSLARFLRSDPERTALVLNASAAISAVLGSLTLPRGATIVLTNHAYGAVALAARRAARRVHGHVAVCDLPIAAPGSETLGRLQDACDGGTAVVIVDQITSLTGRLMPAAALAEWARPRGILTIVDGAHSPGVLPAPVVTEADFWVGNLHKFACAPRGTGALLVREPSRWDLFPAIDSWGSELAYPERFDHQGTIDYTPWLAAPVAVDTIDDRLSWSRVREHSRAMISWATDHVAAALSEALGEDCRVDVADACGVLGLVRVPSPLIRTRIQADAMRDRLSRDLGIETSFTAFDGQGFLRLSAHAYNTSDDYERLVDQAIPYLKATHHSLLTAVSRSV